MADQREIQQSDKIAKQRRDKVKKIFTTFVLLLLALLMVISLVPGMRGSYGPSKGDLEIATLKGKKYTYGNGSAFYYLLTTMQSRISRQYANQADSEQLRQYALLQSVNSLQSMALLHQLANKIGLKPSKEWLRYGAHGISQNIRLENVSPGMREFLEMEYANSAFSPQGGDLLSVVAPITDSELYSYFELVNYSTKAEIVYLNISNYIKSRILDSELQAHYTQNPSYYAESARIESITVLSKELAETIQEAVIKTGWNAAMKKYLEMNDERVSYSPEQLVDSKKETANRFKAILKNSSNNIVLQPVLEDKAYHIIHILGYNDYASLSDWTKTSIRSDYMALNFTRLRTAYQEDIQKAISDLESKAKNTQSLDSASKGSPFTFFRSFNISPINQLLRDENDKQVDLPLMSNKAWMDFLFSSEPGSISKTYYDDAYVVKMKVLKRGYNSDIKYDQIDQQVFQRYMYFKNGATSKDWIDQLQKDYKYDLKEENIKKIYQ